MTQFTYNEAFDPYHAVFRFARLHLACDISARMPFEMLRILDFYLLFPFRLQGMRFLEHDTGWRKISKNYEKRTPYGAMPEDNVVFLRMEPFQRAAAASLVHSGYLEGAAWNVEEVKFTPEELPLDFSSRCLAANEEMADFTNILCQIKSRYPLGGRDGLKDRTNLLEFRYDSI
ncbi:hypothetical protein KM176_17360 [Pseudooceanicola sp. CBS1P-1]|uniref:Uncharacterized protein n=1 Tax=Pseudooceanicola albus TaxID=2692189 RepID=A0A6L7G600_9RHOB|nr:MULTISPECIES: ABC-three component system middle component 5 [Pseudooceanicola]MBT9385643.1 hypothetical protein [Pseudooceanicola endophyticus]MXN18947.1 hypothetical protein [Pseudooceanicola albus]